MASGARTLLVFLKAPVPGKVKTRLAESLGPGKACEAYREMAREVFQAARSLEGVRTVAVYDPAPGDTGPDWLAQGPIEWWPQAEGDLGNRLGAAFFRAFQEGSRRVAAIGADSPGLPPDWIQRGFDFLASKDLVLGPAEDGGYYLIGLRRSRPELFDGVPWSSGREFGATLEKALGLGLQVEVLPLYYDVDDLEALKRWRNGA